MEYSGTAVTNKLEDFGQREIKMAAELLQAYVDDTMHSDYFKEGFYDSKVHVCLNRSSGHVFLSNEEHQAAMINPDTGKLDMWYFTPYEGFEGFFDDLKDHFQDMVVDDLEYVLDIAILEGDKQRIQKIIDEA